MVSGRFPHGVTVEHDAEGRATALVAFGTDVTHQRESERLGKEMARFPQNDPSPVLRIDRNGDVLLANPAAQTLIRSLGGGGDPAKQKSWVDLIERACRADGLKTYELRVDSHLFSFHLVPVDADGYVNLYGVDVTEQRETQSRLTDLSMICPA